MEGKVPIECSQVKVYVGNLPFSCTGETLQGLLSSFGEVIGAKIVCDRASRKPRGFGFVTFADEASATSSLKLNGSMYEGRPLTVRPAAARGTGSLKDEEDVDDELGIIKTAAPRKNHNTTPRCKFETMAGGCKFGNKCKFSHSMSDWSGSGVEVSTKKVNHPSKNKKKTGDKKSGNNISAPACALVVAEERATFLKSKISELGEPSPSQLGLFLKSVVSLLRSAIQDDRAKFNMESIGWSYESNCSLQASSPPSVNSVLEWLKRPLFYPAPEVSLEEFNARTQNSQIATLLSEYGAHDPDWQEPAKN